VDVPAEVGCDLRRAALLLAFAQVAFVAKAETYFLTVAGLGGEQEYEQRFSGWAKDLDKVLHSEPSAKVETLFGPEATKANVEAKLKAIATQAKADDSFVLFLIGHGTFDEVDYKLSLPGPDISATEIAALLDKIQARQLIVNMTSSSGGALLTLEKPKRVIITATKTGTEKNLTSFARYFIEALRDPSADADKNESISALEAFKYAEAKTAKFYETNNHLATEHALLEDAGKGEGVKDPNAENGEGLIAGRFIVVHLGSVAAIANDPEKQKLLKKKEELESSIDELKYRKASMDVAQYRTQLQQFILELAKTQAELDK
jgi:hypothetical protein